MESQNLNVKLFIEFSDKAAEASGEGIFYLPRFCIIEKIWTRAHLVVEWLGTVIFKIRPDIRTWYDPNTFSYLLEK